MSARIDVRLPNSLKNAFFEACETRGLAPSDEIRRLMEVRLDEGRRDEMSRAIELLKRSKDPGAREAFKILRGNVRIAILRPCGYNLIHLR
jgi:hypothetical protein